MIENVEGDDTSQQQVDLESHSNSVESFTEPDPYLAIETRIKYFFESEKIIMIQGEEIFDNLSFGIHRVNMRRRTFMSKQPRPIISFQKDTSHNFILELGNSHLVRKR